MDVAHILRELWERRRWVAPGVVVALLAALAMAFEISLLPPGLKSKKLTVNTASTAILVDGRRSVVADITADLTGLAARASVYSRYMTNLPVRRAIARRAGLPVERIVTEAPLARNQPAAAREPVAIQRSQAILGEQKDYFLRFDTDPGLPTISILSQAPTVAEAVRLANAGAQGFRDYLRRVEGSRRVPLARRIAIRQLGSAEGGTVGRSVKKVTVLAAFAGTLLAWCLLVLLVANVERHWRDLEAAQEHA